MFHVWAGDGPNISLTISCHIHPSALKHAFASGQLRPACTGDRYSDPVDGMPAVHANMGGADATHADTPTQPHDQGSIFFLTSPSRPIY